MSLQEIFTVALIGLALCSCSTVRSLQPADDAQGRGTSYYLPMQVARITVERKRVPPEEFMKAKKKEADELAKAASAAAKLKAQEVKQLEEKLKGLDGKPDAQKDVQKQLDIANAELAALKKAETAANGVVAVAAGEISKGNFGELVDAITIAIDPSIPDRRHRYVIDLNHNMLSDDDWSIKTTPAGFLSTTDVKSTDKFPEIVVELARLAGQVSAEMVTAQAWKNPSPSVSDDDAEPYDINEPFKFERTFDPTASLGDVHLTVSRKACLTQGFSSLVDINKCLLALGVTLQVQVTAIQGGNNALPPAVSEMLKAATSEEQRTAILAAHRATIAAGQKAALERRNTLATNKTCDDGDSEVACVDGLVYRRPQPYAISVMTCLEKKCSIDAKKGWVVAQSYTASLTNASPLEVMPYPRAAFVTTQNTIEFQEGVPVSVRATRPSEVLEGVRIPGRALAGFGEALTQASPINVRYDNRGRDAAQAEAAYYEAQTKALQARLAYEKAQRDADALKPEGK
jgi:hypothetical protein